MQILGQELLDKYGYGPVVALALFLLFNFRNEIFDFLKSAYQDFAKDKHDRRESVQSLSEAEYDFQVQRAVLKEARDNSLAETAINLIKSQFDSYQNNIEKLQNELKDLNRAQQEITIAISRIHSDLDAIRNSMRQGWAELGEINDKLRKRDDR